jgi:hypothetical protein
VGNKNPQINQARKGQGGEIFKRNEDMKTSQIISQDPPKREHDHSRSLDLGKVCEI